MPEPSAPRPSSIRPSSARDEFAAGVVAIAPVVVACVPIALLFGALAAQKGVSTLETMLMSAAVFAGGAQFVAVEIWQSPTPWLVLTVSALLVNIRHVLMGASLAPKTGRFSPLQRWLAFALLADEIWALAERRALEAPLTPAWFAGLALPLYLTWTILSAAGTIVGAALGDPVRLGFDFAFPAIFIALIMGFWKGPRTGAVLAASGLAAVAVHHLVGGAWYIAAGALAGVATAALTADTPGPAGARVDRARGGTAGGDDPGQDAAARRGAPANTGRPIRGGETNRDRDRSAGAGTASERIALSDDRATARGTTASGGSTPAPDGNTA